MADEVKSNFSVFIDNSDPDHNQYLKLSENAAVRLPTSFEVGPLLVTGISWAPFENGIHVTFSYTVKVFMFFSITRQGSLLYNPNTGEIKITG